MKKIMLSLILLTFSKIIFAQEPVNDSTAINATDNIQQTGDSANLNNNMPNSNNDMISDNPVRIPLTGI
jgi:hypothetical protein